MKKLKLCKFFIICGNSKDNCKGYVKPQKLDSNFPICFIPFFISTVEEKDGKTS